MVLRRPLVAVVLGAAALGTGCSDDAEAACPILEHVVTVPHDRFAPPGPEGPVALGDLLGDAGLAGVLEGQGRFGDGTDLVIFLAPERSGELDVVAAEADAMDGVSVIATLDQAASFEDFKTLFADSPELIENVRPESLPAQVKVALDTGTEDALVDAFEGDPRIRELVARSDLVDEVQVGVVATLDLVGDDLVLLSSSDAPGAVRDAAAVLAHPDTSDLLALLEPLQSISDYAETTCG